MKRLIYLSSAWDQFQPEDLASLLAVARRNNIRDGLTGVLLFHDGSFMQVLEGDAEAVDRVFRRIRKDGRHNRILVLSQTEGVTRLFPGWAMALARPDALAMDDPEGVRPIHKVMEDLRNIEAQDPRVATLMRSFLASFRDLSRPHGTETRDDSD